MRDRSCETIRNGVGAIPVAIPECMPSVRTRTRSRPERIPAQGGRAPDLIVVAALGVETYYERRVANSVSQRIQVRRQIDAAAFFACFD